MKLLAESVVLGLVLGFTYAFTGAGMVVLYRTTKVVNFAMGDVATAGLFVGVLCREWGLDYGATAVVVIVTAGLISTVMGLVLTARRVRNRRDIDLVIATIGAALLIQGIEASTAGGTTRVFPAVDPSGWFQVAGVTVTGSDVITVLTCVVVFAAMWLFFRHSNRGIAMLAISERPATASLLGVPVRQLQLGSWALSGCLAGLAGLAVAPLYSLDPTSIDVLVIYGFAAVVAGGFDSLLGAVVCGIAIGILQNLVQAYLSTNLVLAAVWVFLVAVLLWRPQGLLGTRMVSRV
ncbi:MAG: branched-chain amino acid ABC transporter permease [Acidimicrobiales bacterium]